MGPGSGGAPLNEADLTDDAGEIFTEDGGPIIGQGMAGLAAPGEWLVRFDAISGSPDEQIQAIQEVVDAAETGFSVTAYLGMDGLALFTGPADLGYGEIVASLSGLEGFQYVESNLVGTWDAIPNDTRFGELWGLNNTGQLGGKVDADIDAPEAWDLTRGSSRVVAGLLDSGVDLTHPDLYQNIWLNQGEIPPTLARCWWIPPATA